VVAVQARAVERMLREAMPTLRQVTRARRMAPRPAVEVIEVEEAVAEPVDAADAARLPKLLFLKRQKLHWLLRWRNRRP
jgi:hypothetical protein